MGKVKDLTEGSPIKLMILYGIPVLIGNLILQIYNFADTFIVGRSLGTNALAAVGTTGAMFFLIIGFVIGITSGFSVYISQCFGAKDYTEMRKAIFNAFFLWIVMDIIITVSSCLLIGPLLRLINTPESIYKDAHTYIFTIFAGLTVMLFYNALASILRALGDSKTPVYFLIISSILNIGLDLLFIIVFGWGVFGAAFATVLSQFVSVIMCIVYIRRKFPILKMEKENMILDKIIMVKHLSIGLPMAFQFSITAIGIIILQSAVNLFGEDHIAAFTAANKVEQLIVQVGATCGVTIATYVGQNIGAGRIDRIKKGVNQMAVLTVVLAIVCCGFIYFFGKQVCSLFIPAGYPEVIQATEVYLNSIMWFFPPLFLIFVFRNALQAMGKTLVPLLVGFLELITRSIVAYTLPSILGFRGVCLAGPFAWVVAGMTLTFAYYYIFHKIQRKWNFNP